MLKNMLKKLSIMLMLSLTTVLGIETGRAQEASATKSTPEAEKTVDAYRLDFSVNELEDGKRINARQYSMNLNNEDSDEIKIGTRVPTEVKQGEFQYLDVGTSIWCRIAEHPNGLAIFARAEISNFAVPEQQQSRPVLRQLQIKASSLAQLGKPLVLGSVDDPNSKREFQLEVTATKLKE
jgi:hypothetical protein